MNPIYRAAAEATELGWLMGGTTLLFVACFIGWTLWAWSPRNRELMEAAGRIPLDEGGPA